jgi:hypothetical protein
MTRVVIVYSRRPLFTNAAIAASRVSSIAMRRRAAFVDSLESNRLEHVGEIECESFLATQPERIP